METINRIIFSPFGWIIINIVGLFAVIGSFTLVFSTYVLFEEGLSLLELFNRYEWWHKIGLFCFMFMFPISVRSYIKEKKEAKQT